MKKIILGFIASVFALTSIASADIVVRDTISTGTWQNRPSWGVVASNDDSQDRPAITFLGNGQAVSRLAVITMFSDGDGAFNPPWFQAGNFTIEVGFFSSLADWQSDPTRLTHSFAVPSNSSWLTPVATYGGINYHYLELDLLPLNLVTANGGTNLISFTINGQTIMPGALGYLQGGLDGVTDYLQSNTLGPYTGPLAGFYGQFGAPQTNVAAMISLVPAPCAADYDNNGGVDGGDLAAFFTDFEQGLARADVDNNGGVDGGDLAYFFTVFEAGGCE